MKRELIVLAIVLCILAIFITLRFTLFTKRPTKPVESWFIGGPEIVTVVINESINVLCNEYWHYLKLDHSSNYPRWLIKLHELAENNVTLSIDKALNTFNSLGYNAYTLGEPPIIISWNKGSPTLYSDNVNVGILNKIALDEGFLMLDLLRLCRVS